LTNSDWYVTIKTMERDFWNRNRLLGHMPLLVSPMKGLMIMTTLAAKGYTTDGVPVYLWAYGNYRYEVEVKKLNFSDCEVFEGPYEDAVSRFEDRAINGVEMY
jgi:hypothetical protein